MLAADTGIREGHRRFGLALAILIASAYPGVVAGTSAFFFRDFGYFGFPMARFVEESFRRGEIPLWNPSSHCGLPFLAQWNTMVLYPGTWLGALVGMERGLGWLALFHQWLAGFGMYLLARRWSGSDWGGWIAGLSFGLGGLIQTSLMWPNNLAAFGWMPWVVDFGQRAWREGGKTWIRWTVVGALQMLTGAPEVIVATWVLTAVFCFFDRAPGARSTRFLRFGGAVLTISFLAACQLLPFLELLMQSQRDADYGGSDWSMPGTGWANFFVPLFHCFTKYFGVPGQYGQFWTPTYYVGGVGLMFAVVAVVLSRERWVRVAAVVVLVAMILALGDAGGLLPLLRKALPTLGMLRYPVKWVILPVFLLPLMAACGVSTVTGTGLKSVRTLRVFLSVLILQAVLILAISWFGHANPLRAGLDLPVLPNGLSRLGFLLGAVVCFWVAFGRLEHRRWRNAGVIGMLVLVALDLRTQVPEMNPTTNPSIYRRGLFALAGVSQKLEQGRIMTLPRAELQAQRSVAEQPETDYLISRRLLISNCNLLDGVPKVDGLFSLYYRDMDWVSRELLYRHIDLPENRRSFLDFLGVSQFAGFNNGRADWIPREGAKPLVTIGMAPVYLPSSEIRSRLYLGEFAPDRELFLESGDQAGVQASADASARVVEIESGRQELRFRTTSAKPTLAVIANAWSPQWRVMVDGRQARLLKANGAFQAVEVPSGTHEVRLHYSAESFQAGLGLSLVAGVVLCLSWWKLRDRTVSEVSERV